MLDGPAHGGTGRISGRGCLGFNGSGFGLLPNSTTPEEIDRAIVCDSEEPRRERTAIIKLVELTVRFEQRLLNNILAVHYRSGHARAITMQTRTELADGFKKRKVTRLEAPDHPRLWLIVHINIYAAQCH